MRIMMLMMTLMIELSGRKGIMTRGMEARSLVGVRERGETRDETGIETSGTREKEDDRGGEKGVVE
jgi:hypothetical protein